MGRRIEPADRVWNHASPRRSVCAPGEDFNGIADRRSFERRFPMEPRKVENPVESHDEAPSSPPRQEEKKRRFRIVKLEERIAPGRSGVSHGNGCSGGAKQSCLGGCSF
jgi:hypothetical protein